MPYRIAAKSNGVKTPLLPKRETMLKPDQHSTTISPANSPLDVSEISGVRTVLKGVFISVHEVLKEYE